MNRLAVGLPLLRHKRMALLALFALGIMLELVLGTGSCSKVV